MKFKKTPQISIHGSSRVAKSIEGFFKKCTFIWLNLPMLNHLFGYITKLTRKKKHISMYKTLWMPYFLMGIKETNTRTRQSPYAWLMEIIWLQTLNHKSCSTNVVLQNGRNHNHFMEKVQAFGTFRSYPFKALRPPKEDWSWNNLICSSWSPHGANSGSWFHETRSQPGCTVL